MANKTALKGRKESTRKYSKKAQKKVGTEMHKFKHGTLRSGRGGKGGRVTSRKQAIAIGLSEARERGEKVPPPPKRSASSKKAKRKKKS